ncbi:MAG: nuclear transport factor 2 family protein, partial [Proteobacteria bacterium]|nr:nuclear transport factor 2 family protein [Pseudomonadota bacterium]
GRYVTVWRKNAKGEWKGLIDIGNADPAPKAAAKP